MTSALRKVPKAREVGCLENCVVKYDREVIHLDDLSDFGRRHGEGEKLEVRVRSKLGGAAPLDLNQTELLMEQTELLMEQVGTVRAEPSAAAKGYGHWSCQR